MGKIITIIIIATAVWSTISGLIEKHKKEKLAAQKGPRPARGQQPQQRSLRVTTTPQTPEAEILEARIDALRSKPAKIKVPTTTLEQPPVKRKVRPIHDEPTPIKPLHKEDCPLPPTTSSRKVHARAKAISTLLKSPRSIRTAVILSEVLRKPISLRG